MKKTVIELQRFLLLTIYILVIFCLFASLLKQQDGIGMLDSLEPLSIHGTVSVNDAPFEEITGRSWHDGVAVKRLVIIGHFNHDIVDGNSLIFWPRNLRVKLFVNGDEKISTGQRDEFPSYIQYAGNSYKIFYIGDVLTSDLVRIEVEKAYTSCRINVIDSFFNSFYCGRESSVYQSIISNELVHPLIGLALLFVGILVLIGWLVLYSCYSKHMYQIHYLGWFCVLGGISYIYDSAYEFIDLLVPHLVFNTLVDLFCIPLLLFFFLMYTNYVLEYPKSKQFMRWITMVFTIIELIPIYMQIRGIRDLHELQDSYIFLGCIMVFFGFAVVLYELYCYNNEKLKKVVIAFLPFAISLLLKICNVLMEGGIERTYIRVGILVCCILLLHNTFKYIKRSLELIEQEQQMQNAQVAIMLSQIQPHFLYNALNTLQHICKKDGALAAEAIEHFSRYLRGNMDSLTKVCPIPFKWELMHVKDYLYIEQLRFGDRVRVEYDLQVTDFDIPTLTLQPIVENAIRHGITKQAEGGIIKISTRKVRNEIRIIVTDNGVGFDPVTYLNDGKDHVGIENVKKRLKFQCNGIMEIKSEIGVGTQVTIRLKGIGNKDDESHCS